MKYIICDSCGIAQCIENLEPGLECAYCGGELLQPKIITEREWRRYWIGVLGQPLGGYKDITPTKQTTFTAGGKK